MVLTPVGSLTLWFYQRFKDSITINHSMPSLTLYSSPGCHLCDQARLLIARLEQQLFYTEIDISGDDLLISQYGELIPVLRDNDSGKELYWPFEEAEIERFVK
jgi:hypothetical protein